MYDNSAVYNFEIFKQPETKTRVYDLPSIKEKKHKKHLEKLKFFSRCFAFVGSVATFIGCFLFGQAKLAEYDYKVSSYSQELEEYKSKNEQLQIKLNSAKLGNENVKLDNTNKCVETITVCNGDKAVID